MSLVTPPNSNGWNIPLKKEIYLLSEISAIKDLALNPDLDPDHDSPKGLYADSVSLNPKH
jgi:hypothetical protein